VDARAEVITATEITGSDVNEAHRLMALWQAHAQNTEWVADTVVADSKYGTIENFLACHDHGIAAHMPDLKQAAIQRAKARATFPDSEFLYDLHSNTYRCPAGQTLKRKFLDRRRGSVYYGTLKKATCAACPLRAQCTRSKNQRLIERHLRQDILDLMRAASRSSQARRDIRTRQHLMERSFARAKRFGFDRARWRGRWRMAIQEYLTAAIQNIEVLIRYARNPRRSMVAMLTELKEITQVMPDRLRNRLLPCPNFLGCEYAAAFKPNS
jgi:CRISPR/Cas system-associated endoribonuclease Cas2